MTGINQAGELVDSLANIVTQRPSMIDIVQRAQEGETRDAEEAKRKAQEAADAAHLFSKEQRALAMTIIFRRCESRNTLPTDVDVVDYENLLNIIEGAAK